MEFFYKHVHNMNILFIFPKYVLILKWHEYKRKGIVGKSSINAVNFIYSY